MKKNNILVVEDDHDFRKLLVEALHLFDHHVTEAESAEEAMKIIETNQFDLIFSDITMSGMSGLEFTEKFRKHNTKTPIIIISGHSDRQTIELSLNNGVNDYILKPLRIKDLPIIIERNIH